MTVINPAGAAGAYRQVADSALRQGMEARGTAPGSSFQDLMKEVAETVSTTTAQAEQASAGAMTGKSGLKDVVMAVANADVTMQTVVAIRDKVIQAYQDILRMPI